MIEVIAAYGLGVLTPLVIGYVTYRIARARMKAKFEDADRVVSNILSGRIDGSDAREELDRLRLVQDDGSIDFDSNLYPREPGA